MMPTSCTRRPSPPASDKLPTGYYHSARVVGSFVGIGVALVGTYLAFVASAAAVTGINADIGPSENSSLFSTVWNVGQAISMLIFGRLSDRFGRRNFLFSANLLGIVGAVVACTAQTMNTLIGGQVLLGLASVPPHGLCPADRRAHEFLGALCVVVPNIVSTGLGPYIGERLDTYANWRWIFYIYIIIVGASVIRPNKKRTKF